MSKLLLSKKGKGLLKLYSQMVAGGYINDKTGIDIKDQFADFSSRYYKKQVKEILSKYQIKSILDYGCGGSDWTKAGFAENNQSAKEFYNLNDCFHYEPSTNIDERQKADCVISFDVLEHVYIEDVETILNDIFSYAKKLVILNIACYKANAKLPNGENAHITIREPFWWKAQLDNMALKYPKIYIQLLLSSGWLKTNGFPIYRGLEWSESDKFSTY